MRIKKVSIGKYKNLDDFECSFSASNITAFIGNNGSGKSNLLEVITKAFSNIKNYSAGKDLPLSLEPVLDCVIEYELRGINYQLQYNHNVEDILSRLTENPSMPIRDEICLYCGEKLLSKKEIDSALPDAIMLYYAGETLRLKGAAKDTYDSFYEEKLKRATSAILPALCFIDYYSTEDLPLLLLTASAYKGAYYSKFLSLVQCVEISPKFSFILKNAKESKGTADTYWGATGFVKEFLDSARKYVSGTRDSGFKQYYMFFDNAEDLKNISDNEFDLFAKLKALKHYGYLEHVGIELVKEDGSHFSSLRFSEGEKQLGLLMLLTTFTSKHECLYLFDEFDAYLHLNWQRQFSKNIVDTNVDGHILITTHSPATISGMKWQNVFSVREGKVYHAVSETYNRSLDEIMEEQMSVSMRPTVFTELETEFRNAVIHGKKDVALAKLEQIKEIVGEDDPFFITARIAIERMK